MSKRTGFQWMAFIALVATGELYNFAPNDLLWLAAVVLFLVVAPFISRSAGVGGYRELGLRLHRGWAPNLATAVPVGMLFGAAAWVLEWRLGGAQVTVNLSALLPFLPSIVIGSILGATVEEIFFRGYLLRILPERWPRWAVVVLAALLFAAGHWHRWFVRPIDHFIFLFVMGIALVVPALRRQSLWMSIGLHVGHNLGVNLLGVKAAFQVTQPSALSWAAGHTDLMMAVLMVPAAIWLSGRPAPTPQKA